MSESEWLLREEAYALALRGLVGSSLRILGGAAAGARALSRPVLLLRARLLLVRAGPSDRAEAKDVLAGLAQGEDQVAWRAGVDLARLIRSEGDLATAMALLMRALDGFRKNADDHGMAAEGLAWIIAEEVESLRSASTEDGAASASRPAPRDPSIPVVIPQRTSDALTSHANTHAAVDAPALPDRAGLAPPPDAAGLSPPGLAGLARPESAAAAEEGTTSEPGLDRASLLRLVDLGKRLATEKDPDQVLRIVLHEAIDLSGAHRGFLVTVRGEEFEFALAENMDWSEIEQPSFEVSRTLIRRVIGEGRSILLNFNAADGGSELNSLIEIGVRSVACVPLVHEGSAVGVLYVDARDPSHSFGNAMRRFFDLFASQAAAALKNAWEHRAKNLALETAEETIRRHRTESERRARFEGMIGASDAMQEVYRKLDRIVPTELPVIVLGETGTGKELAARLIHSRGPRRDKEFVATNCAGMPETLLESELFGHERGAFTGADRARAGLFEIAHRGTLFLDEVGDMSAKMQASLLRVLQSGEVRRLGGRETLHVDVRVIAATHRDLESMVRLGEFRQDLYFRLNVLSVLLPPLRERAEDIPVLATDLIAAMYPGQSVPGFSARAMRRLVAYPWPGNVRELQNILRRLAILGAPILDEEHLPPEILMENARASRPGTLRTAEAEAIRRAMDSTSGNKLQAAKLLGVDRKTLYKKLRRLGP